MVQYVTKINSLHIESIVMLYIYIITIIITSKTKSTNNERKEILNNVLIVISNKVK